MQTTNKKRPGKKEPTVDELLARCKDQLASFKVPRAVHVVDSPDLPRSPVLISPSGWRIEGLSVGELVELAGRL